MRTTPLLCFLQKRSEFNLEPKKIEMLVGNRGGQFLATNSKKGAMQLFISECVSVSNSAARVYLWVSSGCLFITHTVYISQKQNKKKTKAHFRPRSMVGWWRAKLNTGEGLPDTQGES